MKERIRCRKLRGSPFRLLLLCCALLFVLLLLPTPLRASPRNYQLVRLHFKDQAQIQAWVDRGLDVWQVDGNTVLVSLAQNQVLALQAEGFHLEAAPQLARASFPSCYRTYDDMVSFFHEREARFPQLFRLHNLGETWETRNNLANRYLYVARLTSPSGPQEKPKFLLVAALHAREIITPEVAMNFIDDLLSNYGHDPLITWLLDTREVWVIPMANPDGHARAAQVEDWRKNADRTATCANSEPPNSYGVDLNRNFGYEWGQGLGASQEPCYLTYRGEASFSEPETQAVRSLLQDQKFDLLISLHSYGDLILYPWAYTWHPAPDAESLDALAVRMAADTDYMPMQAPLMGYTASGDLADWSYGALGIPSFTFEIGGIEDGYFWPACDRIDDLYQEVRPALIYAVQAAKDPYQVAGGPEARHITIQVEDAQISIRAQVTDRLTGGDRIETAELFIGSEGRPGTGIRLSPVDGACNSANEWMDVQLDTSALMDFAGQRVPMLIVGQQEGGKRGVPTAVWLDLRDYQPPESSGVQLWMADDQAPAFEIRGPYVYQGPAEAGSVVMTIADNRIYRGEGITGEVLFTINDDQLQAGTNGPVIYSRQEDYLYRGNPHGGMLLYRIDNTRLVVDGHAGSNNAIVMTANVDLTSESMETASLLLPALIDGRF